MMTTSAFLHPLHRSLNTLTLRLRELDRAPEDVRTEQWWRDYVATVQALADAIESVEPRVKSVTKRELAARFGKG